MDKCWREGENVGTSRGVVELLKLVVILLFFLFMVSLILQRFLLPLLVPILHPDPQ